MCDRLRSFLFFLALLGWSLFAVPTNAFAEGKLTILHVFKGGTDGANPYSTLVRDANGNIYGTTLNGGTSKLGTVFVYDRNGKETVLHSFAGGHDGAHPYAGLTFGPDGMLYGTTYHGGKDNLGTVYRITPNGGHVTILHAFKGIFNASDGSFPYAGVTFDVAGILYGTTVTGGSSLDEGTLYEILNGPNEIILHAFTGQVLPDGAIDGAHPYGTPTVLQGPKYFQVFGTTFAGGWNNKGTIYRVLNGTYSVYSYFPEIRREGDEPLGQLAVGTNYQVGTTSSGGDDGLGAVFVFTNKLAAHSFEGIFNAKDGSFPQGGIVLGSNGIFYGTTLKGGNETDDGAIFSYDINVPGHPAERIVYRFSGSDGSHPYGGLVEGAPGTFYGTTSSGGSKNLGVFYQIVMPK